MKNILIALCLLAGASTPASAELTYTVHMAVQKSDAPSGAANNPLIAMMGETMMKQLLPSGGADLIYTVGEKGVRIEYLQAAMGQEEGSVNLSMPDGTLVVVNPKEQTYWKITAPPAASMMKGEATVKPTGQFETVAGVKCEVVGFDWKMDLPIPESARANLPPNFPTSLLMTGDTCIVKDQFQRYAELASHGNVAGMLAAMGLDKVMQGGIVLRQSMRMAGMEMTSLVTKIGEQDVPASAFEIPAGYKEVPPPTGLGMK
ncbi:MAG: hypothetical protein ABJC89_06285 [Acidobacteriota bacterium]